MISSLNSYNQIIPEIKRERENWENWEVIPNQNIDITITSPEEQAKAVVLFIHGGPDLDFTSAITQQEPFFTDLAEKKFVVIAPHFPYSQLNHPDVDYRDLLDSTRRQPARLGLGDSDADLATEHRQLLGVERLVAAQASQGHADHLAGRAILAGTHLALDEVHVLGGQADIHRGHVALQDAATAVKVCHWGAPRASWA